VQGDGPNWEKGMPQETMFSVYGSSHVGFFGGTIQKTNVPEILQIDCRLLDMYQKQKAYPSYLFFNPYQDVKTVEIPVGSEKIDIYDTVSHSFLQKDVSGTIQFSIPSDGARILVFIPSGKKISVEKGVLKAGGLPIDFRYHP
jgi:hypothetical protein